MYEYNCKIVRIIAGDRVDVEFDLGFAVWLNNQRLRLFGVDSPESRTRDAEEKKFGILAKNFVKGRLPVGSMQILRTRLDDSRGKFGRILGEFVLEETTLNQLLIVTNNGVPYFGQSKEEIEKAHLENRRIIESRPQL